MRLAIPLLLSLLLSTIEGHAGANPIELSASPVLGSGAPGGSGWFCYGVNLHNNGNEPFRGHVELRPQEGPVARAPISVGTQQNARVQLCAHATSTTIKVRARNQSDDIQASLEVRPPLTDSPVLYDLSTPTRLAAVLRGESIAIGYSPPSTAPVVAPSLTITQPEVDRRTGEMMLPDRPAGYNGATVVLVPGDRLASLSPETKRILADWILAGGTLAVSPRQPEELRSEPLATWIGGRALFGPIPESVESGRRFQVPVTASPGAPAHFIEQFRKPEPLTGARAVGYTGGNLRPTAFGASATYGLGEVHLLTVDPNDPELLTDPWVQLTFLDLVRHAWDRRAHLALPHASAAWGDFGSQSIRRVLDPNEGARWAIVVCAIALLVYAFSAGPINFVLARRAKKPLQALKRLPLLAAAGLVFVVTTGFVAKGGKGQARHLALIEAGAGMSRAALTRYRALFASSAAALTVTAYDRSGVMDLVGSNAASIERTFTTTRSAMRLENFATRPWETMLVREDGFTSIAGGVSLVAADDGDVLITNRLAHDLVGVVARVPDGSFRFFPRIADGSTVRASAGKSLPAVRITPSFAPSSGMNALEPQRFAAELEKLDTELRATWEAVAELVGYAVDFWPADVPVLIGEIHAGERHDHDSGLPVERDQQLIRVVGYGGAP